MPSIKVHKTEEEVLNILKKVEDRFLIKKDGHNVAKLYFDYDENTRLEIKSTHHVYHSRRPLISSSGSITLNTTNLSVYGDQSNVDDIFTGSLVSDGSNIGVISEITHDSINNTDEATIVLIYSPQTILWHDYY